MLQGTLDLNPDLIYSHTLLGRIALAEKDCAAAAVQMDWVAARVPPPARILAGAYEAACRGETLQARADLKTAAASVPPAGFGDLAVGYALLGDQEAAIANLQKRPAGART